MAQNINVAPQLDNATSMYATWAEDHEGSLSDFFTFMTTPSLERTKWLKSLTREVSFDGPYCITKYS